MGTILAIATILGGIAAIWFFWDKIAEWLTGGNSISQHDVDLYSQYKALFLNNGAAEFYKNHDFLGSFPEEYWRPLSHYVDSWGTVEHEFVNKRVNEAHKKVYSQASMLGITIAKYTVTIGPNLTTRSVRPDNLPPGPIPDQIKEEAKEINDLVPSFSEAHEAFVRIANSKLHKNA